MSPEQTYDREITRNKYLADSVVLVDGFPGCGKTLFGPIISSLSRVEIMQYIFEIEFICRLSFLNKIDKVSASALINMLTDQKLYQTMMGRDTNFRFGDLSGVFKNPFPLRYFKRIFSEGDMMIPEKIETERPILNFVTHDLLSYSEPLLEALENRLTYIEVVRHPLYMIIQQTLNMERLYANTDPRDIQIYYDYNKKELPYFCLGWEEDYLKSNNVEKAIFSLHHASQTTERLKKKLKMEKKSSNLLTIPFEAFVVTPEPFIEEITSLIGTKKTRKTSKVLREQNVPRIKASEGIPLDIYKRCGWEPSDKNLSEREELNKRREWIERMGASKESLNIMDSLSENYERNYNYSP